MKAKMRIAVVQTNPLFGEVKKNTHQALDLMATVSADLYILPELFNTGYNFIDKAEVRSLAESLDGPTSRTMVGWTKKHTAYVVYGFAEQSDRVYNSAVLMGSNGIIGIYRKIHLFDRENLFFAPGNLGFPVFNLPFGKVGIMICFDWIYPESARSLALKGAQLIAHPANLVLPHCPDAIITRCLENSVFIATADRVGEEKRGEVDLKFIGSSEIVAPTGEILCRLGNQESAISSVDADLILADNKQINEYNHLIKGRRTGQYKF